MSALATTRADCVRLLDGLVSELGYRMADCRDHGVRNVWRLPEPMRPVPIVVVVDEVAELFLMADKSEKDEVAKTATDPRLEPYRAGQASPYAAQRAGQGLGRRATADLPWRGQGASAVRVLPCPPTPVPGAGNC